MYSSLISNKYSDALVAPYMIRMRISDGFIRNANTGVYAADTAWADAKEMLVATGNPNAWGYNETELGTLEPSMIQLYTGNTGTSLDTCVSSTSNATVIGW